MRIHRRLEVVGAIEVLAFSFKTQTFFIHANNWGKTFEFNLNFVDHGLNLPDNIVVDNIDFPTAVELSFVAKSLVSEFKLDTGSYPVSGLDSVNKVSSSEIDLHWVNS